MRSAAKGAKVVKTDAATAQEADALLEDILGDLDGPGDATSSGCRCAKRASRSDLIDCMACRWQPARPGRFLSKCFADSM